MFFITMPLVYLEFAINQCKMKKKKKLLDESFVDFFLRVLK